MCDCAIFIINVGTCIGHNNWSWCWITRTCQRDFLWFECYWQTVAFNVNDNFATVWYRSLWIKDDNSYLNYEHKHRFSKVFSKKLSGPTQEHGLLYHNSYRKRSSKRKWTDHEYHVLYIKYGPYSSVKISCATTHFPPLPSCGPHAKPHGMRGLSKHYHFQIDPKLGHGKCKIRLIPCACI